jgi:hypothetical protein
MQAEEVYGRGRYFCGFPFLFYFSRSLCPCVMCFFFLLTLLFIVDVGNGTFEPGPNVQPIGAQAPYQQNYGATAAGP